MASRLTTLIVVLIVGGTLIAGLIVGAQREDLNGPVDLIITNGRVYTGRQGRVAEAVAVRGNKILRVGTNREIKRLRRPQTITIDAHGATVAPGFNDSHAHLLSGALSRSELDLLGATTREGIEEAVRSYAAAHPDQPWIVGRGWYYEPFGDALPTRQQLDALVPDRPAYLISFDGHCGWANSLALEAAGITRRTKNPPNGTIVREHNGSPAGTLEESAMALMDTARPHPSNAQKLQALRDAVSAAHAVGLTSVQDAGGTVQDLELFETLRKEGALDLRIYQALSAGPATGAADLDRFDAARKAFPDDPLLKTGAIKLMVDGVVESHTAALLAPYADRPTTSGEPHFSPADLNRLVTSLDRRGWQVMIHAIGDRGIRMALDAFEQAQAANPNPPRGRRHRVEHIETLDPADLPRFGRLGVVASMQPYHGSPGPHQLDSWIAALGDERAARGWLYGSLIKSGARVAFGSDWPVVSLDPRYGLHVATTRTSAEGEPAGGWLPAERIGVEQALSAYTADAAWASFDEQRKGTLEPGMLADIVILSSDVLAPGARVLDAEVAATIFDGRVVFTREESSSATE
jgi:predicted amidohydrolase YtcJ